MTNKSMHQILLAVKPRLMCDMLKRQLAEAPETTVVGEIDNELDLLLAIRATQANVVLHSWNDDTMPPIYTHLLNEFPGLLLVGLLPSGERAMICEQRISTTLVEASSIAQLLTCLPSDVPTPADLTVS